MTECVIEPYRGVSVGDRGTIRFGSSLADVQAVLGPGRVSRSFDGSAVQLFSMDDEAGPHIRVDFPTSTNECAAVEFIGARTFPPTLFGQLLGGRSLYEAARSLARRGYEPWNRSGPAGDLLSACRPPAEERLVDDTLYFHEVGVCFWTSTDTIQTEEGDLFVLDTVLSWSRRYWEGQNRVWAEAGLAIQVALP